MINTTVFFLSYFQYSMLLYTNFYSVIVLFSEYIKALLILYSLNIITKNRPYILENQTSDQPFSIQNFIVTYGLEAVSYSIAISFTIQQNSIVYDCILFIPISFMYELIFDFFHYWTHRLAHSYPILYKNIHKKHHEYKLINSNTTFHHSTLDLVLTNVFPIVCASYILPTTPFTLTTLFWYKTIVEVSGHTGKDTSGSFIQCIYLPESLGISLYSRDHLLHHTNPMVNFSKRFSIWDRIFGTYHSTAGCQR